MYRKNTLLESERIVEIAGAESKGLSLCSAFSILSQNRDSKSAILVQDQVLNSNLFVPLVFAIFLLSFNIQMCYVIWHSPVHQDNHSDFPFRFTFLYLISWGFPTVAQKPEPVTFPLDFRIPHGTNFVRWNVPKR